MPAIEDIEAWFHEAREIPDSEERLALLKSRCGDDHELLQRILEMVDADSRRHAVLDVATRASRDATAEKEIVSGSQLGPFEVVRLIGKGGMGTVYEAVQREPIERRVALKVIRYGFAATEFTQNQFVRERQALSRLQHPNIATILDAGIDSEGRLFFAMELLNGDSITSYCDEARLSIEERLAIFEDVCSAVHHAHQRGVLHLDIKPSNLMIQSLDGDPIAKLIDFGIAETIDALESRPHPGRTSDARLGDTATSVDASQAATTNDQADSKDSGVLPTLGTPLYMSPEQMFRDRGELDVRSDVYSLGALLYEVVVGTPPMDRNYCSVDSKQDGLDDLRNGRWPTPVDRWTAYPPQQKDRVASQRQTSTNRLRRTLEGEVAAVILKCLKTNPNDRYESAAAIVRDLCALRENRPLDAVTPTFKYHGWKMFQRNRTVVSTAAAFSLLILVSAIVASVLAVTNHRLRTIADRRSDRLAIQSRELVSTNQKLRDAVVRATTAESRMRAVADQERRNAAISRAVNRYSLVMIDESRQSGFRINTTADLPRLTAPSSTVRIPASNRITSEQSFQIGGVDFSISSPSATVSSNVQPLVPGGDLNNTITSTSGYLELVVSVFGGSLESLQQLVLEELRVEFGERHPIYLEYASSLTPGGKN
ncbi:MAG: serine/threonine-protein kinase [Planctomycetota bacterium]